MIPADQLINGEVAGVVIVPRAHVPRRHRSHTEQPAKPAAPQEVSEGEALFILGGCGVFAFVVLCIVAFSLWQERRKS